MLASLVFEDCGGNVHYLQYVRELFRLLGEDLAYEKLGREMLSYAQLWMGFVVEHCERGRGRCPQ